MKINLNGYQTINLNGLVLTQDESTTVSGLYDKIVDARGKPLLLGNFSVKHTDSTVTEYTSAYATTAYIDDELHVSIIGSAENVSLSITNTDSVVLTINAIKEQTPSEQTPSFNYNIVNDGVLNLTRTDLIIGQITTINFDNSDNKLTVEAAREIATHGLPILISYIMFTVKDPSKVPPSYTQDNCILAHLYPVTTTINANTINNATEFYFYSCAYCSDETFSFIITGSINFTTKIITLLATKAGV